MLVKTVKAGGQLQWALRRDWPFHLSKKECHQRKSDLKSMFMRIQWLRQVLEYARSMRRCKNVLPACTTLQACASSPISESISRFVAAFLPSQWTTTDWMCSSFSLGRRMIMRCESSSIPKNVSAVEGPSILSAASGTPNLWHTD